MESPTGSKLHYILFTRMTMIPASRVDETDSLLEELVAGDNAPDDAAEGIPPAYYWYTLSLNISSSL